MDGCNCRDELFSSQNHQVSVFDVFLGNNFCLGLYLHLDADLDIRTVVVKFLWSLCVAMYTLPSDVLDQENKEMKGIINNRLHFDY
jgi:hypothetical protein